MSRLVWLEPRLRRTEFGNIQQDALLYQFRGFQVHLTGNLTKPELHSYGNGLARVWDKSAGVAGFSQRPVQGSKTTARTLHLCLRTLLLKEALF